MRAFVFASLLAAGCVRAPAPLDVTALIAKRGPEEARRDLAIRVLDDPRDVQARLALAALADQVGRPTEAIEQLEAVQRLGGPLGTRWHAADRARLAKLLLARARVRIARGAPSALADLERTAQLGGTPSDDELVSARIVVASSLVRHVDAKVRARGRTIFAAHAKPAGDNGGGDPPEENAWLGARAQATPEQHGAFGVWLWANGARREAYDQLHAWHAVTPAPRDAAMQGAYLRAYAWWVPLWLGERPLPPAEDLVGDERCQFPGADCVLPIDEPPSLALSMVDFPVAPGLSAAARYAASRFAFGDDSGRGVVRRVTAMLAIAKGYARDPGVADRLASDFIARATDGALAHAALGGLFDAIGDRARARAAWQAAVAQSDEVAFVRGLAQAVGRAGDGPAANVFATQAGAASGDPAVVWNAVGYALLSAKQYVDALTSARTALDLAGPDELGRSLDLAIACSRALGRSAQVAALEVQRAELTLALTPHGSKPNASDVLAALEAYAARPNAITSAQLWVAAHLHPRDIMTRAVLLEALDTDDSRRAAVIRELLELSGDPDSERALAAVAALRAI